jgi:small subunit ribosomal protein S7
MINKIKLILKKNLKFSYEPFIDEKKIYTIKQREFFYEIKKNNKKINLGIHYKTIINYFINIIMKKGKKSKAENILYDTIYYLRILTNKNPLQIITNAIIYSMPRLDIRILRRGRKIIEIPRHMKVAKSLFLAINWLIRSSKSGNYKSFYKNLAHEMINTIKNNSKTVKLRHELYKKVILSRINMRYRRIKFFRPDEKKEEKIKKITINIKKSASYLTPELIKYIK